MDKWLLLIALLLAAPLAAQAGAPGTTSPDDNAEAVDPWADFEVGGPDDGAYLPLSVGRDRTGLGLRARASFGWDSNIFKEEKHDDTGLFTDAAGQAYVGMNFGIFAIGARAALAGRLYFGEPDAGMWDLKLGGFFKVPYNGGWGGGISGDVLYQQLQTYEITGPVTRQDDLRAAGAIGRAYVGYQAAFLIFELGLTGQTTDFTEESDIPSYDSWTVGMDFGIYMEVFGFLEVHPFVAFDYEWFRDQVDLRPDGTPRSNEDKLQLLKFTYGADFKLNLPFFMAQGRAYSTRQDDSAAGHDRYCQYGAFAAADFHMVSNVRLGVGAHVWRREFDERVDPLSVGPGGVETVHESMIRAHIELAWNFWEFVSVGGRYTYIHRASNLTEGSYMAHEATVFLEIGW